MTESDKPQGPQAIGWNLPPWTVAGTGFDRAAEEAHSVCAPVLASYYQEATRAVFVVGAEVWGVIEPRGALYRCRYARYPEGADGPVTLISQLSGVERVYSGADLSV